MANPYFRKLPSFEYVSRLPNARISDYIEVKNLFKRGSLRPDIFQNTSYFEKYRILDDERPDNVAYKIYGESTLDWLVLLSNNMVNIQSEWPLTQNSFDEYLREKYGVGLYTEIEIYDKIYNGVHHYETIEVKNSQGIVILPEGLTVPEKIIDNREGSETYGQLVPYFISYYDIFTESVEVVSNVTTPITNYHYEERIETKKRDIYVLKARYLNIVLDDMEIMMKYKKGATQYVSDTLKRADNIRLYS